MLHGISKGRNQLNFIPHIFHNMDKQSSPPLPPQSVCDSNVLGLKDYHLIVQSYTGLCKNSTEDNEFLFLFHMQ